MRRSLKVLLCIVITPLWLCSCSVSQCSVLRLPSIFSAYLIRLCLQSLHSIRSACHYQVFKVAGLNINMLYEYA